MIARLTACLLLAVGSASASAQTQIEMNVAACAESRAADDKLNAIYRQILRERQGDVAFIANLKKAQRAWLRFRDAQLAAIFPAADKRLEYGSVYPVCDCNEQAALVNQRIAQLSGWLSAEEGDVCRGSR